MFNCRTLRDDPFNEYTIITVWIIARLGAITMITVSVIGSTVS